MALENSNKKDLFNLKEKYKQNIEKELLEKDLIEKEIKKEEKIMKTEQKTKSLKRIQVGDIEPNMTLKSLKRPASKRYNFKH